MRRNHRLLALIITLLAPLMILTGGAALAQDDAFSVEDVARSDRQATGGSLIQKFFITIQTDATGEQSIEWIGSAIIWFLLTLSMLNIGLIGFLALTNQRKSIMPEGVVGEVKRMLAAGQYREALNLTEKDESYFGRVMHAALHESSHGYTAVIRALEQTADELTTIRLRRIEFLNVLGQVSPMIGLFGTVYGMILAFQALVATGGNAEPIMLAGGIATALVTTFWGLLVAIPALAAYAIIRNRIDELTTDATLTAEAILNQFRPKMQQQQVQHKQPQQGHAAPAEPKPAATH